MGKSGFAEPRRVILTPKRGAKRGAKEGSRRVLWESRAEVQPVLVTQMHTNTPV